MITSEISDNVANSNHRSIMSKGTSIKDAIAKLEEREQCKASECEHVSLIAQLPPIEKMDASLSSLSKCVRLSMSTNAIEKIANLNGLKNLKILSLGRNNIKSLTGIEAVGDTLEELWISYNRIDKLKGVNVLKKLKVLFMSNNNIADSSEFVKLADLPCLEELVFIGNPLQQSMDDQEYVEFVKKKVPKLKILDGSALVREDD